MPHGESSIIHEVVMKLAIDLENKGHCITTFRQLYHINSFVERIAIKGHLWKNDM